MCSMRNLVILISGRGSNMQALVRARAQEQWPARIQAVISDRADAPGLAFAAAQRIRTVVVEARAHTRASFEAALMEAIDALAADFIVLALYAHTHAGVRRALCAAHFKYPSLPTPQFSGIEYAPARAGGGCSIAWRNRAFCDTAARRRSDHCAGRCARDGHG